MKNYSPKIAAQRAVRANVHHGLSRKSFPDHAAKAVTSVLTEVAHTSALTGYARQLKLSTGKHLKNSTTQDARQYLKTIATAKRQSTVDLARQAISLHIHPGDPLPYICSEVPTVARNRAYSPAQIQLLCAEADPFMRVSIALASDAGLREMELLTLARFSSLTPSDRRWHEGRFFGREDDVPLVVHGKGGLVREVRVSQEHAEKLKLAERIHPVRIDHRGAHLTSHFDLVGGHRFSSKFGRLSQRVLGFSHGGHGLRHSFAQRRRDELLCLGFCLNEAIQILSHELGHFATKNTLAYLRD